MTSQLSSEVVGWLNRNSDVKAAVLFGSAARIDSGGNAESTSDLDLHVVTSNPAALETVPWTVVLPTCGFIFQTVRPATGGVRKVTAIFCSGQIELVVVPEATLSKVADELRANPNHAAEKFSVALNEMATCLHSGFRFLKGEEHWGAFYTQVSQLRGVRISNEEAVMMADTFLADLLWVLQKIDRGEYIAAQHALHTKLSEVNLRLWRELRLRRNQPLPSFGLGRRIEEIGTFAENEVLRLSAEPVGGQLQCAALHSYGTLKTFVAEIQPGWSVPPQFANILLDLRRPKPAH